MSKVETRNLIYAALCAVLFLLFLQLGIAIWFLFLVLAIYYGYGGLKREGPVVRAVSPDSPVTFGQFGSYAVDGDDNDLSYGMYIQIGGRAIFIDIREDRLLEGRKRQALLLHENRNILEKSLKTFIESNPEFQGRDLKSIGLHAEDLERGEVFWEPDGYSLLRGLQFGI